MAILKFTGTSWTSIAKLDNIAPSSIAKIGNTSVPSSALPSQTGDLWNWSDPSSSTVGDTTVPDLTYQNYGTYSAYDNSLAGSSGPAIVDLSGTKCWYLNGTSGDIVVTNNVRSGSTNLWPPSGDYTTYTMEMWVRSNGSWIRNGNLWNIGYNLATRARLDYFSRIWTYLSGSSKTTSGTLSTNTWHHIVWTMTSQVGNSDRYGTLVVYKNGSVMQTFTNINQNPSYPNATQFFGGYSSTSEKQRFYLGLQRRYGIALTAAEVLHNYNLEKADYGY